MVLFHLMRPRRWLDCNRPLRTDLRLAASHPFARIRPTVARHDTRDLQSNQRQTLQTVSRYLARTFPAQRRCSSVELISVYQSMENRRKKWLHDPLLRLYIQPLEWFSQSQPFLVVCHSGTGLYTALSNRTWNPPTSEILTSPANRLAHPSIRHGSPVSPSIINRTGYCNTIRYLESGKRWLLLLPSEHGRSIHDEIEAIKIIVCCLGSPLCRTDRYDIEILSLPIEPWDMAR